MSSLPPAWLPLGFHEWQPVAQAATLGLLTFVQEDVPTVSAALLAAAATVSYTEVIVSRQMVMMRYAPGTPCCTALSPVFRMELDHIRS